MVQLDLKRVLITPTCTFKLYSGDVEHRWGSQLRSLASAWIYDVTAGFVFIDKSSEHLQTFWWEGEQLLRTAIYSGNEVEKAAVRPLTFANLRDFRLIAYEAESWRRHMARADKPSLATYLKDTFA